MQKGKIGVTSENIFPIIKKFLYSDHEIFLREIVSNAVDATQKMAAVAASGEYKGELGDTTVRVKLDKGKKTITVSDHGIGMTSEEIEKYINQIAFSSAGDFLEKYKDNIDAIIGHFGLGFYSSFMVSEKVEIVTKSYKEGAKAVKWSCDGSPEFTMDETEKEDFGTDIILYIDEENKDFLEESKITQLLNKYCKFLPVPIGFGKEQEWKEDKMVDTGKDKIINNTKPAWTRKPVDLKDEDYRDFYHELYPVYEEPLFYIHLNVDYPFNLTGILYFPKIKEKLEISRNKIQLYCNQVFVTDSVENIVPDFLTLLHGVIDSPDIPLNVSRSYLQSDSNVKKISNHITKKVSDRLEDLFKNEREKLEEKWDNLKIFIEYGMLSDEKFNERAEKFALLKNADDKYFSYEEYRKLVEANQTDKHNKVVYLYSTDKEEQYSYIESAKNRGYDVLIFDSQLDAHFINHLEAKLKETTFARVDSAHIDRLIEKDEVKKPELPQEEQNDISEIFESVLPKGAHYSVSLECLGENENAVLITQNEFMRRYRDMSALGGGMNFYGSLPESYSIVVNYDNHLIKRIIEDKRGATGARIEELASKETESNQKLTAINDKTSKLKPEEVDTLDKDEKESIEKEIQSIKEKRKEINTEFGKENQLVKQVSDLALLSNGMLKGEELSRFIKRTQSLIK